MKIFLTLSAYHLQRKMRKLSNFEILSTILDYTWKRPRVIRRVFWERYLYEVQNKPLVITIIPFRIPKKNLKQWNQSFKSKMSCHMNDGQVQWVLAVLNLFAKNKKVRLSLQRNMRSRQTIMSLSLRTDGVLCTFKNSLYFVSKF